MSDITKKASFIRLAVSCGVHVLSHVIRIKPYDVSQSRITLKAEVFLIVVNVEYRLIRIDHSPCYGDPDLNGITETVVYLLSAV